jgi:hypothetical protein
VVSEPPRPSVVIRPSGPTALEARDHGDLEAFGEFRVDIGARDRHEPRRPMRRGGVDRHLPALPAARRHDTHFLQAQRHQPGGDILARGDHGVIFARIVTACEVCLDPADQLVGLARHGADDDDHVIATLDLALTFFAAFSIREVGHRGAAEFHHQKRHPRPPARSNRLASYASAGSGASPGACQSSAFGASLSSRRRASPPPRLTRGAAPRAPRDIWRRESSFPF